MLQSYRLKQYTVTIGINKLLSNSSFYKHICLENINQLYKYSGKCENQQQYKSIIQTEILYTPEGFTENSPISPVPCALDKIPSTRKSLPPFTEVLGVKN